MLQLRRSALRVLSSQPSSFLCKPRSISSLQSFAARSKPATSSIAFQKRWATGEAEAKEEEEVPISELQPTPQEEVENAIHEDNAADAATATEATKEATPPAEPSVIESVTSSVAATAAGVANAVTGGAYPSEARTRSEMIEKPKETVYVGNLFFDVTENDLKKEFTRFGNVTNIRLLRDSRGLSKGFGYVDYETTESATAAISALNQQIFEGRRLTVQYAAFTTKDMNRSPRRTFEGDRPKNPPSKTLFIGNMSFEMTDRDLTNLFRGIKNVIDVRVAIDRRTGQPRGFAHADFLDVKSAMDAMAVLAEKESYGRKLRIDYSFGSSNAPRNQPPPER